MSEWIRKQDAIVVATLATYNFDGSYDGDREEFIRSWMDGIDGVKFDPDLRHKDEETILCLANKILNFAKSNNVDAIDLIEFIKLIFMNYDYRN